MTSKGSKSRPMETLHKEDVLQAVIICDTFNSWFEPISLSMPMSLIPLVNVPVLEYTLRFLALSDVQETIIFCSSHADQVKEYIRSSKWSNKNKTEMIVTVMVSESCRSLGDAMRDLDAKAVIRNDFILLSGNIIANVQLIPILECHRKFVKNDRGAVMTMVYKEAGPGHNSRSPEDETVLVVDSRTSRMLYHKKVAHRTKKIVFPLETFVNNPKTEVYYNLQDTFISICSPSVPPLFSDNFDFQSRDDFVRGLLINEEILSSTIYWHRLSAAEYASHLSTWHMYQAVSRDIIHRWVYPLVPDSIFPAFGSGYMYLRHNVYRQKNAKLGKGCILEESVVLSEDTSIGENTYITCSVIGRNCKIGNNVKVSNAHIWDNVVLEDNVQVDFSLIASGSILRKHCKLTGGCIAGPGVIVPSDMDLKGTYLVRDTSVLSNNLDHMKNTGCSIENVGEKCIIYMPAVHESDSEEEGKGNRPSGLVLDMEESGDSTGDEDDYDNIEGDDLGESDMSYRNSPMPDDVNMFYMEVLDSLSRGLEDKLPCDNLILEINSSRYAYNVSVQEVNYNVVRALLNMPENATEVRKVFLYFLPILKKYIRNGEAQNDCLQAFEDTIVSKPELSEAVPKLLHFLYDSDILEEDVILEWYNTLEESSASSSLRKQVSPFIKWLQEAESDSSDG